MKLYKSVFLVASITILSKILGFVREIALAYSYGASAIADSYVVATTIPNVIFSLIGVAIGTTFIPKYLTILKDEGSNSAIKFFNNIINIILIISLVFMTVAYVFIDYIVKVFSYGFNETEILLTRNLTSVLLISLVFVALVNIFSAYLNANQKIIIPLVSGIILNIMFIISIMFSKNNVNLLAWGGVLAYVLQFIFIFIFAKRDKYKYKCIINFNDKNIREIVVLIIPVFIGMSINQINVMIDRMLGSTLNSGSISALNYGNKVVFIIITMVSTIVSTIVYPKMAQFMADKEYSKFRELINGVIKYTVIICIPIMLILILESNNIVSILFERGEFNSLATELTSNTLVFFAIGIIPIVLRDIITRVYYSMKNTKTPLYNSAIGVVVNIILNLFLINSMQEKGLAFATSISSVITTTLLIINLKNYKIEINIKLKSILKILLSGVIMIIVNRMSHNLFEELINIKFIMFIISVIISFGVYFGATIILGLLNKNTLKKLKDL